MRLAIKYAILALIATIANIAAQDLVVRRYSGAFSVVLSVLVGTGVGLLVKYVLDKRYIFRFNARSAVHDGQTFLLYCVMGVFTTAIFWASEFGFNHVFQNAQMRYLGGVIGLAIGYVAKYHLDKRYVFKTSQA